MAEMLEGKLFYASGQQRNSLKSSEKTLEIGEQRRMVPAGGLVFFYIKISPTPRTRINQLALQ